MKPSSPVISRGSHEQIVELKRMLNGVAKSPPPGICLKCVHSRLSELVVHERDGGADIFIMYTLLGCIEPLVTWDTISTMSQDDQDDYWKNAAQYPPVMWPRAFSLCKGKHAVKRVQS